MRKYRKKIDQVCHVCGDKASGRNFGGISCESCKAFFRRTAIKDKTTKCRKNKTCKVEPREKKCQKCRLERCFAAGMRREFIRTDEERQQLGQLIHNKRHQKQITECKNINIPYDNEYTCAVTAVVNECDFFTKILDDTISTDALNAEITEIETYLSNSDINSTIISQPNTPDSSSGLIPERSPAMLPYFEQIVDYKVFNELETNRLLELFTAANALFHDIMPINITEFTNLDEYMSLDVHSSAVTRRITKVVHFSDSLSLCDNLYNEDKLTLVKYGNTDVSMLRSVTIFDYEAQCWRVKINNNMTAAFRLAMLDIFEHYDVLNRFINNIYAEWDSDSVILDLLTAIVFFNPNRPKLNRKEIVRLQQYIYMYLLQRYLLIKYGSESQTKFGQLMAHIMDLDFLSQLCRTDVHTIYPDVRKRIVNSGLSIDGRPIKEFYKGL